MKKLLFALLTILSLDALAQKPASDFTISVTNPYRDLNWVLSNEGDMTTGLGDDTHVGVHAAVTPFAATPIYTYSYFTKPGMFTRINKLEITTDGPCKIRVNYNRITSQPAVLERISNTPGYSKVFGTGGGSLIIDNIDIFESGNVTVNAYATTTTDPNITVSGDGRIITQDFNWNAKWLYLAIGDSREYSAGGLIGGTSQIANPGYTNLSQRILRQLRAEGKDFRLRSAGISGETSTGYRRRIEANDLGIAQSIKYAKLISIDLGTNDAAAGTAASQNFDANMQFILDEIFAVNPTVSLILKIPYGSSVPNCVANMPAYRSILAGYASLTKYNTKNFFVVDQYAIVPNPTASNDANFTETVFGTQQHGRWDTMHLLLFNQLMPIVRTTSAYLNN